MATSWDDLARHVLFEPLGMTATSYRYEDYENAASKAVIHVPVGDATLGHVFNVIGAGAR